MRSQSSPMQDRLGSGFVLAIGKIQNLDFAQELAIVLLNVADQPRRRPGTDKVDAGEVYVDLVVDRERTDAPGHPALHPPLNGVGFRLGRPCIAVLLEAGPNVQNSNDQLSRHNRLFDGF